MGGLYTIIIVVQVVSALAIIGLVLVQHGKGADMGAAFGSGASGSLFGASGSSNFLSKSTAVAAVIFFISTLALVYVSHQRFSGGTGGVMDKMPAASAVVSEQKTPASAPQADKEPDVSAPRASGTGGQIPK